MEHVVILREQFIALHERNDRLAEALFGNDDANGARILRAFRGIEDELVFVFTAGIGIPIQGGIARLVLDEEHVVLIFAPCRLDDDC